MSNIDFLPASAKLAVKYRPGRWNTGHLATPGTRRRRGYQFSKVTRRSQYTVKFFKTAPRGTRARRGWHF